MVIGTGVGYRCLAVASLAVGKAKDRLQPKPPRPASNRSSCAVSIKARYSYCTLPLYCNEGNLTARSVLSVDGSMPYMKRFFRYFCVDSSTPVRYYSIRLCITQHFF